MTTPLAPPVSPNPRKNRQQELEALQDSFDQATGRRSKGRQADPWHREDGLSQATKDLLDQLEPKQKGSGGFYQETAKQKKQQEAFDQAVKNIPANGTGTYKLEPVSPKERLLAWHKSLGTPAHVVEQELKALEQQEAKK